MLASHSLNKKQLHGRRLTRKHKQELCSGNGSLNSLCFGDVYNKLEVASVNQPCGENDIESEEANSLASYHNERLTKGNNEI